MESHDTPTEVANPSIVHRHWSRGRKWAKDECEVAGRIQSSELYSLQICVHSMSWWRFPKPWIWPCYSHRWLLQTYLKWSQRTLPSNPAAWRFLSRLGILSGIYTDHYIYTLVLLYSCCWSVIFCMHACVVLNQLLALANVADKPRNIGGYNGGGGERMREVLWPSRGREERIRWREFIGPYKMWHQLQSRCRKVPFLERLSQTHCPSSLPCSF